MEIPFSQSQTSPTAIRPTTLLAQLQPGQTLQAKVESILANNQIELRIGNQLVKADSPVQLAVGQVVKLRVESGTNGVNLRIAQQANQIEALANAWRASLPKQQPIVNVVRNLAIIAKNQLNTQSNSSSINSLRTTITKLLGDLPTPATVSQATGLRQAIQNSGVTLEAQLRQSLITGKPPQIDQNLKANLLRVAETALALQTTNNQTNNTSSTGQPALASTKSTPVDAYTALLNSTIKSPLEAEKNSAASRPLLPPLPLAPSTHQAAPTPGRLLSSLPALLQKIFHLPQSVTSQGQQSAPAQTPPSQQIFSGVLVDLINQLESGLARIQQHQLNNMSSSDDAIRHFLNLELPVFNGKGFENIGMRFEWEKYQQNNKDTEKQHQWRVVLNFDFDTLGKTQVTVRAGQDQIHTDFKSEHAQTQALFEKNKYLLVDNLKKQGLTPGQFRFTTGHIKPENDTIHNENLLKTKA